MKYFIVILAAACIDTLQLLIGIAMTGVFVAAGLTPVVGQLVGFGGELIGQIIDLCISMTFGGGFIFFLWFQGLLSGKQLLSMERAPFILVKFIPFLDLLPSYTALAVACVLKKRREEKSEAQAAAERSAQEEDADEQMNRRQAALQPAQ